MLKFPCFLIFSSFILLSCSEEDSGPSQSSSSTNREVASEDYNAPEPPESQEEGGEDPLLPHSWHLENTGQKSFAKEGGKIGEDVGLGLLHHKGPQGEGIKLAFSDNGVELTHPELWPNHLPGKSRDYSSSSQDEWHNKKPYPLGEESIHAHGTSVTGLAVASAQNGIGSKGLAPKAKFAGFLYVGVSNSYSKMLDQAHGDFDIFNYSYGRNTCRFSSVPSGYIDQLQFGVNELRDGLGAVYVKAAGNEFVGLRTDCVEESEIDFYLGNAALEREHSSPYMIVVGANNARGRSASYSTPGSALWISAPGGEFGDLDPALIGPDLMGCQRGSSQTKEEVNDFESGHHIENESCDYTSTMNGTSGSTPLVSAAVALILEANPELSWREVKLILAQTARKIDPFIGPTRHPVYPDLEDHTYQRGWQKNAAGFHFHNWYGLGALDVSEAVKAAKEYSGQLPKLEQTLKPDGKWKYESADQLGLAIPDADAQGVESEIDVQEDLNIEAVQIRLSVEHTFASDLGVELTSPAGTVSQLMTINSGIAEKSLDDVLLLSNAFLGESSQGTWTLKVIDGAEQDLGVLENWKINIWGHDPVESGSNSGSGLLSSHQKSDDSTDSYPEIDVKLNQEKLQSSTRGPALPSSGRPSSAQRERGFAAEKKVLKTTGEIHYEWKSYAIEGSKKEVEGKVFEFIDFAFYPKQNSRLDVYAHKNTYRLEQRSLEENELSWERSFSLPEGHSYAGVAWLTEDEFVLVSRDPQGVASFWNIHKERPIGHKKLETKILTRLTQAKVFMLETDARFLVWDDYFLHTWAIDQKNKMDSFKPVSFEGQKIQSVFKDEGHIYVWTTTDQRMNLWKLQNGEKNFVKGRERGVRELKHLPLSRESFLARDEQGLAWLNILEKDKELKEEIPGFPRLSGNFHVHKEQKVEGEILILWVYEPEAELFHQFKFYLEGSGDEE